MTYIATAFALLAILLTIASCWRLNWLIILSASIGIILFEYGIYSKYKYADYLSYVLYFSCISLFTYFIESRRITGNSINSSLERKEFKQFLLDTNQYIGYKRLIYQLPKISLIFTILFAFGYYLINPQQAEILLHFFANWDEYPSTPD